MKPLLLAAAALLLAPAAAHAQVAAGTMPNTFDDPNARAAAAAPAPRTAPAPAVAAEPAHAESEDAVRSIIAELQAGQLDYGRMTADLAAKVREQEAVVTPIVAGFGALVSVDFAGSQNGIDLYNVMFANAATQWRIGFSPEGKVSALLFRPAE